MAVCHHCDQVILIGLTAEKSKQTYTIKQLALQELVLHLYHWPFFCKNRAKMQKIGQKGFAGEKKCLNLEFEYEHQALQGA